MPPAPPCKAITPQIAWHGKEPVLSIDVSVTGFVATGGADNEVVLWRLRLNKEPSEAVCWVQTLTGIHTKVSGRGLQTTRPCLTSHPTPFLGRSLSTSCASAPTASRLRRPGTMAR
jgi:hypothetical protein